MTHEELYKKNGVETSEWEIPGYAGIYRHGGEFTDNNPYAQQLVYARKNQDKDALYAQAVEWQANYYNTLEQREYNDPVNVIARQRRAGINPDLAGASGSLGSAGAGSAGAGSAVPPTQSGVEYSNAYDTTQSVVSGIGSVCNVVNSIATLGTATVNAIEQVKTMPSRVSVANTEAYIADETKDAVVNQAKNSNIFQRLSLVKDLAGFFTPESSDEDFTNILTTLGYPSEQIPSYQQAIKNYQTNPVYQSSYQDGIKRSNELSAYNSVYTTGVQGELYERSLAIQTAEQNITTLSNNIRESFVDYLSSNGFGEIVANNEIASANLTTKDIAFQRTKLERDVQVFAKNLEDIKTEVKRFKFRIEEITHNASKQGRLLSPTEQLEIDALNNLQSQMLTLGSTQLQSFYGLANNAMAISYQNSHMVGNDGYPVLESFAPRFVRTLDVTFGDYVKSDNIDLASLLIGLLPKFGR